MNVEPLIGYTEFIIGYILFLMAIRLATDIYVKHFDKSDESEAEPIREISPSQRAIRNYKEAK